MKTMKIKRLIWSLSLVIILMFTMILTACQKQEPPILQSVSIIFIPDKTEYLVGEIFESEGMVVSGLYSDGTRKDITEYTIINEKAPLTKEDEGMTITVGTFNQVQPIIVMYPSESIVITFDHGIDITRLYANGEVYAGRGTAIKADNPFPKTAGSEWSWDGTTLYLKINQSQTGELFPTFEKDEQNNLSFEYLFQGSWSLHLACPYSEWGQKLTADTRYPVAE